ncbi:F-box/LRR-repeat protein 3 [Lathyrus oleraceus]|nr:F-box/LRR-repeat protein 3-like [Pisum sativum]
MELKRSKIMEEAEYSYLPDECWECVFEFLNHGGDGDDYDHKRNLKSIPAVCKQWFTITNRIRSSLTIYDPTAPFLSRLFHRFTNLTSLDLTHFHGDLDSLLLQISLFPLKLTSLNISHKPTIPANGLRAFSKNFTTLTSLICSHISSFSCTHLFLIAECFPLIEELDLHLIHPIAGETIRSFLDGFEALSSSLLKLRKLDLTGHFYMNDKSIMQLFKNCKHLEEVSVLHCFKITRAGVVSALGEKPTKLRYLCLPLFLIPRVIDSLMNFKNLTYIDLSYSSDSISDEILTSIAMEGLPLKTFIMASGHGYSYAGIFSLLSKCQSIQHLELDYILFLNDNHVMELSSHLVGLLSLRLSRCFMVTYSALFSLVMNCPSLSDIKMEDIGGKSVMNYDSLMEFGVYPQLKSLYLRYNSWLSDESITMIVSHFPNLHLLDLKSCKNISQQGIIQVLKRCHKISHLNLSLCNLSSGVKLSEMNFEVPKLKMLNLSFSEVDDATLYVISKNCPRLLQLLLNGCLGCTEKGVKYVLENCTQLREIDLGNCLNVHINVAASVLFSSPSLRKITVPPHFRFSESERKLLLRRGCIVCPSFRL